MKRFLKCVVGMIVVIFLTTAYSAAPKASEVVPESGALIEVCSQGTAYVPPGTRYVTCQGKVMRVVGSARMDNKGGAGTDSIGVDCYCPKCCGGTCAIIVNCGGGSEICVLYLACGD